MHCLVAEGAFDVACEPVVSLWDLAALPVIVEEAGGRFTDLGGRPGPDGGSAVSAPTAACTTRCSRRLQPVTTESRVTAGHRDTPASALAAVGHGDVVQGRCPPSTVSPSLASAAARRGRRRRSPRSCTDARLPAGRSGVVLDGQRVRASGRRPDAAVDQSSAQRVRSSLSVRPRPAQPRPCPIHPLAQGSAKAASSVRRDVVRGVASSRSSRGRVGEVDEACWSAGGADSTASSPAPGRRCASGIRRAEAPRVATARGR